MIDLTGEELYLAEKVLNEEELGNDGEPIVDESREIDLVMDTYEPEHDHQDDVDDQQEADDRMAFEAEQSMYKDD